MSTDSSAIYQRPPALPSGLPSAGCLAPLGCHPPSAISDSASPASDRTIVLDRDDAAGTRFLAYFPFEPRPDREKHPEAPLTVAEHLRAAVPGVRWDKSQRAYHIPALAANLRPIALFAEAHGFTLPERFEALASQLRSEALATLQASRAVESEFEAIGLGGTLLPYQRAGAAYLVQHQRVLLADDMGLGKTVQALAALAHLRAFPAVIVCPASLLYNWQKEATTWLPAVSTEVITGPTLRGGARITIMSYDMLGKHVEGLRANGVEAVVLDEAHYCKSGRTKRFAAAKALVRAVPVRFLLSGTPMENRPVELMPLLQLMGRVDDVGGFWKIAKDYCGAVQRTFRKARGSKPQPSTGPKWDLSGRGNVREFGQRLRATCMVRRMKSDIARELPPKRRVYVPLPLDNQKEYDFARKNTGAWIQEQALKKPAIYRPLVGLPEEEQLAALARIAYDAGQKCRNAEELVKLTALQGLAAAGKLPAAIEWIRNLLETGANLVLFAHRRTVIERLASEFRVEALTGSTSAKRRSELVNAFQTGIDPATMKQDISRHTPGRLFLANLLAGGTGLTLTAASNVALLEQAWNPAKMAQAEDRCDRYGQESPVTAWHLMGQGSIDYHIRDVALSKTETALEMLS